MTDQTDKTPMAEPVIVYGALRSGTTMFRLMLDHHAELTNPCETDFLLDYIQADPSHPSGWRYDRPALEADRTYREEGVELPADVDGRDALAHMIQQLTDKTPGKNRIVLVQHRHAEKIAKLFPKAPVLHLLRDPRDTARSSVGMGWDGNSYFGVRHWIHTERGFDAAEFAEGQTFTFKFETLISDIKPCLMKVCEFIGVPFSEQMLTYHENSTYDPPSPNVSGNWRTKALPREIARIEARAGTLLEERGYEPASTTPYTVSPLEEMWLGLDHRVRRWGFNIRRYGLKLFVARHLTKALGMKQSADRFSKRQEHILMRGRK